MLAIFGGLWWSHVRPDHKKTNLQGSASQTSQTSSQNNQAVANQFDKNQYSTTDPSSIWVVVNKQHPLSPINYAPADLTPIGNGQYMRAEAASALVQMVADAKAARYNLTFESGYRSYATQTGVYNNEVRAFGQAKADTESARPGYSEHQTGWAVDLGNGNCIEDCFGKTEAAAWVLTNAYKYGFLHRYPSDKSGITGYRNEPWHFRYIGKTLSQEMRAENVTTLEEFFGLPAAPDYN